MQWIISQIHLKRSFALILASLTATALFGGMVHVVLVAANVAEPAATTVYGFTDKRIWSTAALMLALVSVIGSGLALLPHRRLGTAIGRLVTIVALVAGLIALVNGWLVLVTANGGPNSGNGVVAGAMAVVLGVVGVVISGLALIRSRRIG